MGKAFLVLLVVLQFASSHGGEFNPRDEFITDAELKVSICRASGVYGLSMDHEDLVNANCGGTMEYRLKGRYFDDYGDHTITHYEVTKAGHAPCTVKKYIVPSSREVVLQSENAEEIGSYKLVPSRWEWKAIVPEGQGACFN